MRGCYIVDDYPFMIKALSRLVKKMPNLRLLGGETDPLLALNKILSGIINPDILFLDIDMPGLSGLSFSRQTGSNIAIIFVTAHDLYYKDSYEIGAVDYLLKPVKAEDFFRAVKRAEIWLRGKTVAAKAPKDWIFVRLDNKNTIKVNFMDILWVKAEDKRVILHLTNGQELSIIRSLSNVEETLPASWFLRIHKSYLINVNEIKGTVGRSVLLSGGKTLEIGPSYMDAFYKQLDML